MIQFNASDLSRFFHKKINQIKLKAFNQLASSLCVWYCGSTCFLFVSQQSHLVHGGFPLLLTDFHVFLNIDILLYCWTLLLMLFWIFLLQTNPERFYLVNKSKHYILSHRWWPLSDCLIRSVFFFISGRVRYMFASFWNRNHALRNLQRAAKNFHEMLEAEKKVTALA